MDNNLIHAPLESPNLLIDVGCGTGIVSCHLGAKYPTAQIYGVDLSSVPPRQKPSNVEFIVGDVRQLLNHDARVALGTADLVFSRLLVLGMTDWAGYVRDMASLVRSGGWVEMQDVALEWYLDGVCCSGEWEWSKALALAAEKKGWDPHCGRNLKGNMHEAGLVDISVREYSIPMGTWMVGERPETRRIGEHTAREFGMVYYHAIPKMLQGMGYAEEKIEEFRRSSGRDLAAQDGKELRFYVTVGRKP